MKKTLMTLKPEEFKLLKSALGKDLKRKCDFCKKKITSRNFGYLAFNTVSCKDMFCVIQALRKEEQMK